MRKTGDEELFMLGRRFFRSVKSSRLARAFILVVSLVIALPLNALAHAPSGTTILVLGSEATNEYTNTASVTVEVTTTHAGSGGLTAARLFLSNDGSSFIEVKFDGDAWPSDNRFAWTLAAGADGPRTVYARVQHGGNEDTDRNDSIILDTIAPSVTRDTTLDDCSLAGDNGWCTGTQTAGFAASDAGSGLANLAQASFTQSTTTNGPAVNIASGSVADVAGNVNPGINAGPFMIDSVAPSAAIDSPADGDTTSDTSIQVVVSAADATSGLAGVSISGAGALLDSDGKWKRTVNLDCGPNTITAQATDNAGLLSTEDSIEVTRTCVSGPAYTIEGFYQPVENKNVMKGGAAVPLKFNILADGVKDTSGDASLIDVFVLRTPCTETTGGINLIEDGETVATNKSELKWNGDQWVFNWKSPKVSTETCYKVTLTLDGGDSVEAQFNLRK